MFYLSPCGRGVRGGWFENALQCTTDSTARMNRMVPQLRLRCIALAVMLLVSHTLMAAHMATHAGKSSVVECRICLCQANEPHGLLPETLSIAGIGGHQPVCESVAPGPREGVTIRAFLQRAPPSNS